MRQIWGASSPTGAQYDDVQTGPGPHAEQLRPFVVTSVVKPAGSSESVVLGQSEHALEPQVLPYPGGQAVHEPPGEVPSAADGHVE